LTLDIDWDAIGGEAADILSRYIRIDTSNPPGGEANAAQFLAELCHGRTSTLRLMNPLLAARTS
jgi:hypothetical protein